MFPVSKRASDEGQTAKMKITLYRDVERVMLALHRRERHFAVEQEQASDLDRLRKL